jgi:hypothetical protein
VRLGGQIDVSWTERLKRVSEGHARRVYSAYHFDLPQRVIAVIVEVMRFSVINADYTKKKLSVKTQCEGTAGGSLWPDDDFDVLIDLVLQDLGFGKLLVLVGGKPDASKLARLVQQILWKKHGGG